MTAPLSVRIHRVLRADPMTDRELSERLGARMRSVSQARLRMLKRGTIKPCGYGPRITKAGHTPHRYALT